LARIYSILPIAGAIKKGYFFISKNKVLSFYYLNQNIGDLKIDKACRVLRIWQRESVDGHDQIIVEKICHKKYIEFDFFKVTEMNKIYSVKFRPKTSVIDFDSLKINEKEGELIFEFLSSTKLEIKNEISFNDIKLSKGTKLIRLTADLTIKDPTFTEHIVDNIKKWRKDLNLRYIPNYRVVLKVDNKILINLVERFAVIDLDRDMANWVHLDSFLIGRPTVKKVNNKIILSEIITPYDFSYLVLDSSFNYLSNGSFYQQNLSDPLMGSYLISESEDNIIFSLKSYYHLSEVRFDQLNGQDTKEDIYSVPRFDFLGGVEQNSLLTYFKSDGKSKFIVDGSYVHENNFTVFFEGKRRFQIPINCQSLSVFEKDQITFIPFVCDSGEMQIIKL
jgi:hypothetical protein